MIDKIKTLKLGNLEIYPEDAPEKMNWNEANRYCKSLGDGWRLPFAENRRIRYN